MNFQISDRVLWVGLGVYSLDPHLVILLMFIGVSLFLAARRVSEVLYQVRELTQIKREEKDDHVIGEGTEEGICRHLRSLYLDLELISVLEALKLETLQKLSESTSYDLRTA